MKNTGAIIMGATMVVVLFVRLARCGNAANSMQWQSGQEDYFAACQLVLDSTEIAFAPVKAALSAGEAVPEERLQQITSRLYDLARDANNIDAFNDAEGHYKKRIAGFVELLRGLTCCYLKSYAAALQNPRLLTKGTITNLENWMHQYRTYGSNYQAEPFNYHNGANFTVLKSKLQELEMKIAK